MEKEPTVGIEALEEIAREEEEKLKALCDLLNSTEVTCAGENPDDDVLHTKHSVLRAELLELEDREPEGIPLNQNLQVALLRQQAEQQVTGLEDFTKHLQLTRKKLIRKKEKLQGYIDMEKQVVSLSEDDVQDESYNLTPENMVEEKIKELKGKNNKMKALVSLRTAQLRILLKRIFPQPDEMTVAEVAERDSLFFEDDDEKKSLLEIIELLMNASLIKSDPWVTIDSTMWTPYIELLLNTRLALRHPSNKNLIRLEKFHE